MIEVVVVWLLAGVLIGYFIGQRDALKPYAHTFTILNAIVKASHKTSRCLDDALRINYEGNSFALIGDIDAKNMARELRELAAGRLPIGGQKKR